MAGLGSPYPLQPFRHQTRPAYDRQLTEAFERAGLHAALPETDEVGGESPPDGAGMNERSCHEHYVSQMQLQPL